MRLGAEIGIDDMKTCGKAAKVLAVVMAVVCAMAVVACAPNEGQQDAAAKNRAYMSQANTAMMQLNADLKPFTAAVAAEDLVTSEQAASDVYRDIDAFTAIVPPDPMKDIHAEYSAGCTDLKAALQAYIEVYQDAADGDGKDLSEAVAAVQKQYDSGIAHLQAADKLVTELTGALPESSSSSDSTSSSSSSK